MHSYSCFHRSLPSAAAKQRTRSLLASPSLPEDSFPLATLAPTRSMTKTRPCETAGPAKPPPIGCLHSTFSPSDGNFSRMPVSRHTPSRLGPSHCGQSAADKGEPAHRNAINAEATRVYVLTHFIR